MTLLLELIAGMVFGIEHVSPEEDDDFKWVIAIHFAFLRLCIYKF